MEKIAEDMKFSLVLKFDVRRPPIETIRLNIFRSWGFMEKLNISFMDKQHILLHLKSKIDYMHAWAREERMVAGCNLRLFNWTDDFDVEKEPMTVAQWLFLPGLPLGCYYSQNKITLS